MKNRFPLALTIACVLLAAIIAGSLRLRKTRGPRPPQSTASANVTTNTAELGAPPVEFEGVAPPDSSPPPQDEIVGIGAILRQDRDRGATMIVGVAPGSPAAAAGLAGNFVILKIDDIAAEGIGLQECVKRTRGPAGTTVRLELFDTEANETRTLTLTRQRIKLSQPP